MKLPGQCFLRYCRGLALCGVLLAAWAPVALAEFRSVADHAVVLYDAPSLKAKKLHILGRNYPVEIVVMVKVNLADVRQATDDKAPLAFQAEQNVLLDLVELTGTGWARVAHRDGQSGYIKLNVVWGV